MTWMWWWRRLLVVVVSVAVLAIAGPARVLGQEVTSSLTVVVLDPSGAVIVGAGVSVLDADSGAGGGPPRSLVTDGAGEAVFRGLTPGVRRVRVSFPGFATIEIRNYRLRTGANRREVVLPLATVAEGLDVGRDGRDAALDPGGNAFSTVLTRDQIDALPDDPDELEAVLRAMAPPGAVIRIDGFSGGRLPPKARIRSIRLPRGDQFAAENHGGINGLLFIDIVTQPGTDAFAGAVDVALRDEALDARNPFTPVKGRNDLRQYGLSASGPVVRGRSSFSLTAQRARQRAGGTLLAALPGTIQAEPTLQPTDRTSVSGRFDQALGDAHALRATLSLDHIERRNLGVGGYELPERAYATRTNAQVLRLSESGPVGRSLYTSSRLQLAWQRTERQSQLEAPAVRVLDAFTSGGAQQSGSRRAFDVEAATDLDVVSGSHAYRTGVLFEAGRYRTDVFDNYLGTVTFSSLADYEAGRPSSYTRRSGDPLVAYGMWRFGAYVQDDYRVARSVLLSYGVRYEAQSYSSDRLNLSPRASVSWAPFRRGSTTVRVGWGRFTDWIAASTYELARTVDGLHVRETTIADPAWPDVGSATEVRPSNRYVLDDDVRLPGSGGLSVGLSQSIAGDVHLGVTWARRRGWDRLRGLDLNASVDGVRPDPGFADVVRAEGDAAARSDSVGIDGSFARPDWHRLFVGVNYMWSRVRSNTTGPFSRPASGSPEGEWGADAPRHRAGFSFSVRLWRTLSLGLTGRAESGAPYTLTSGVDGNGDGIFDDRPAGVPRASLRTAGMWDVGLRASYAIGLGGGGAAGGGDVFVLGGGPDAGMPGGFAGSADGGWRLEVYVSVQNLTNHANYVGYSGVETSPFFGRPTNVLNPRTVQLGARFSF